MRAQPHPISSPRIKVILHIDTARTALTLPNTPILLKGLSTINRRLVNASRHSDVVGSAIGSNSAFALRVGGGVERAVGFNDVVFNERVAGPAIDGEVAVALGLEGTTIVDGSLGSISKEMEKSRLLVLPASTRVPALAANKVTCVAPGHRVFAAFAHGVLRIAAAIGPPRVEVAVVVAYGVGSGLAFLERCDVDIVTLGEDVEGCAEDTKGCRAGKEKGSE